MPFGVDPKTVLCIFYKQGNCEKGKKCKFSHDLAVERKQEKKSLYQDTRDGDAEDEKKKDDMVNWDEGRFHGLENPAFDTVSSNTRSRETSASSNEQARQP